MNKRLTVAKRLFALAAVLTFFQLSFGQKAMTGVFVSLNVTQNNFSTEGFNGETIIAATASPFTVFSVPELNGATGIGASVGIRQQKGSLELNYTSFSHEGSALTFNAEQASHTILSVNLKRYFLTGLRIQPFIEGDWLPYAQLKMNKGALVPGSIERTEATYHGGLDNFRVGGGVAFYWTERIGVHLSLLYRYLNFESVSGEQGASHDFSEPLDGTGVNGSIAVTYTLF